MPPYIPPELTDKIISYVESDIPRIHYDTLRNCALVKKNWLPASRSRLLQQVEIDSKSAYHAFVNNVLRAPHLELWLASVECLQLVDSDEPQQSGKSRGYTGCFVHDFVGHLPNLQVLLIKGADWNAQPPHPRSHLALSRFSSLQLLSLHRCKLPSAQTLRRMICALSASLEELVLDEVTWPPARAGIFATNTEKPIPGPALLRLDVWCNDDCVVPFLWWLLYTPTQSSLRYLFLTRESESPPARDDYAAFFQAVAPGIETLSISYEPLEDLPFYHFKFLRNLELYVSPGHWHTTVDMFYALPSGVRIRRLNIIQVLKKDQPYSPSHVEQDGLELMEPILQGGTFAALEGFQITVDGGEMDDSEAATVEAHLLEVVQRKVPRIASKGLISVQLNWGRKLTKAQGSPETEATTEPVTRT